MEVKLLSGALGAEISGIDLKDSSKENYKKINNLLLEHKVIFFRNQDISHEEQIALAQNWGPLENHCLLYTSPSPRDGLLSRMPSSA